MQRKDYPSDRSRAGMEDPRTADPTRQTRRHRRTTDMREVLTAIVYLDRTGGPWRALPHDFPPWATGWSYCRRWRNDGTWKHIHTALREKTRVKQGREPTPSAASID